MNPSAGARLRAALVQEKPLQIVGAINAFSAILAEQTGFRAIYLSGAGVANASFGLPDIGITTLDEVLEDTRRVTGASQLPLLVDADTGWGGAFMIARAVKEMTRVGAAGLHIEDQVSQKRCGHRPGKSVVPAEEMVDRVKAAVDARTDDNFVIVARTDAFALEGLDSSIERARRYTEAGADMIFAEALASIGDYKRFVDEISIPVLANMTEFGVTPLLTLHELSAAGVGAVLYPLSAFRAMSSAALDVYREIREKGTQKGLLDRMQTREELYDVLNYYEYEQKLDRLFPEKKDA